MPEIIPIIAIAATAAGGVTSYSAAKKSASANQDIARQEQANEALRRQAMELDARRKQMEVLRNQQRARALALSSATNQGANLGSGIEGGYGQIQGQAGTNQLGIQQGLDIGRQTFGNNAQISQDRINLASFGSEAAMGAGFSSFGNSMLSAYGPAKNLFGGGYGSSSGYGGTGYYGNYGGTGGNLGGYY